MKRSAAPSGCARWTWHGSKSPCPPMTSTGMSALAVRPPHRLPWVNRSTRSAISANIWPRVPGSIVQVDVGRIGGITPWLKVAHAAEAFDIPICPHFLMELHVSLVCAVPNGRYVEYIPQLDEITSTGMKVENGFAVAPMEPGIGIDWDEDALKDRAISEFTTTITQAGG